ncbi:3-deoxy-D-arabinoheptulosonate-7-phosphate synthase [Thermomonospora umbrina]|uniref:Phospho-2-dehydro-3-deoxyheptonate aldolase n=1 Tax=Thermomonospora umbrina TaxID=111806 RepID=A0A3D9SSU5_9ACTN|nr:3-deoxy-D-arabinoheptulosonate-7-phosphate synthase [Thermomonospora umbrina]
MIGVVGDDGIPADGWSALPARQQPRWSDPELTRQVRAQLAELPGLVSRSEVDALRALLAEVARGERQVVQAGDCAEDPAECTPGHVNRKAALLERLADVMRERSGRPVVRVGRIAGQFVKPRSNPTERVGGRELPVYRGHQVNGPEPDEGVRQADPKRVLAGYWAAVTAVETLRGRARDVWTSHEALLLDYEVPLMRESGDGLLLTSTHWPWIGERTRQVDGAHVALLADAVNPVSCKVGPAATPEELTALCERLDPNAEPGRLTLIARMGVGEAAVRLPALVEAVRAVRPSVIWLCDPMHGNTVAGPGGRKTRHLDAIVREIEEFHAAVTGAGAVAGGLHLETTPDEVTECAADATAAAGRPHVYTSLCDPRLNATQAVDVVSAWRG